MNAISDKYQNTARQPIAAIFDFQKLCLGNHLHFILTTQGCPNRCYWCCSPETQSFPDSLLGWQIRASEEFIKEIMKYVNLYPSYSRSLLITGGEPFLWPDFIKSVCSNLHELNFTIEIKTSGNVPWHNIKNCVKFFNHIFYDVKHLDSKKHKSGIFANNNVILENLGALADLCATLGGNTEITVCTPLVKNFNDKLEDIKNILFFVNSLKTRFLLIPVRQPDKNKYLKSGLSYPNDICPSHNDFLYFEKIAATILGHRYIPYYKKYFTK